MESEVRVDAVEPYLDTDEAALFLKSLGLPISRATLATRRVRGGGPKFLKFGRFTKYSKALLREYADEQLSQPLRSTSEIYPPRRRNGAKISAA